MRRAKLTALWLAVALAASGCAGNDSRKPNAPAQGSDPTGGPIPLSRFAQPDAAMRIHMRFAPLRKTPVYSALIGLARDHGLGDSLKQIESSCGFFWPHTINEALLTRSEAGTLAVLSLGIGTEEALTCANKALGAVPYMQAAELKLLRAGDLFFAAAGSRLLVGDRRAVAEALRIVADKSEARAERESPAALEFRAELGGDGSELVEGQLVIADKGCDVDVSIALASRAVAADLAKKFQALRARESGTQTLARRWLESLEVRAEGVHLRARIRIEGDAATQAKSIDMLIALAEAFQSELAKADSEPSER